MVYQWKAGFRANVPAQVAGERLEQIRRANDGFLTPAAVVDDAASEDSPLHPGFTWDDAEAARLRREDEARRIIRNCYVIVRDAAGNERPCIGYLHVDSNEPEPRSVYVTSAVALTDADYHQQVVAEAIRAFESLRARYQHIEELEGVFREIDRVNAGRRPRKAKRELQAQP